MHTRVFICVSADMHAKVIGQPQVSGLTFHLALDRGSCLPARDRLAGR